MDDPFFFATALKWYKRRDVQEAILADSEHREVSPRFGQGFGKRPDALYYPADVLSFATKKATSFHCSEERWRDPLSLKTGGSRRELDDLRIGWDLVLDIDCPYWLFSKLTAQLFITALEEHGVTGVNVKFSGNKGFHLGVPWEAFPEEANGRPTKDLFPEAPRAIASFLLDHIATKLISVQHNTIVFDRKYKVSYEKLKEVTGKEASELVVEVCRRCRSPKERKAEAQPLFLCASCGHTTRTDEKADYLKCERCGGVMTPQTMAASEKCGQCGGSEFEPRFNVQALIEVDTILLASRHLFRTPYSLHEKSKLVSVVFPKERIMAFEKDEAKPANVKAFTRFLDPDKARRGEAAELLVKALDFAAVAENAKSGQQREYAVPEESIPEELFPPCMRNILAGMDDGKKRAMFALTNFFRSCGWGHEQMAARIEEWNKKNPEPLREVNVKGHLRYTRMKKEIVLPPNCKSFYQDLRVCTPDNFCRFIKNPAQYSRLKAERISEGKSPEKKTGGVRLTDEQKAMRKAFREKKKQEVKE